MANLRYWSLPWRERARFTDRGNFAPEWLCAELRRHLAALSGGPLAGQDRSVGWAALLGAKGALTRALFWALLGRVGLLATVTVGGWLFDHRPTVLAALALALLFLACQILGTAAAVAADAWRSQVGQTVQTYVLARCQAKILRLGPGPVSPDLSSGMLKSLFATDARQIGDFAASLTSHGLPVLATLAVLGPEVVRRAGGAGVLGLALSFAFLPLSALVSWTMAKSTAWQQRHQDRLATLLGEWLRQLRLSRFLGWQELITAEISRVVRRQVRAFIVTHVQACLSFGISFGWWMVPVVAMLIHARARGLNLAPSAFLTALWVLKDLGENLQVLPHSLGLWAGAKSSLERLRSLEAQPDWRVPQRVLVPPPRGQQPTAIVLRGVGVRFGARDLLTNVNLELPVTGRTAIVGSVGAGKTTLLKVLAGDLAPTSGDVLIRFGDSGWFPLWDQEIHDRWRSLLAAAPEQAFVSDDTVQANVALGAVSEEGGGAAAVVSALAAAEMAADLAQWPHGVLEPVGESGIILSGGQRQRLGLARAFYSQRPLLLADDPLSAVDPLTEGRLIAALDRHYGSGQAKAGLILTSHRFRALELVERVIVLEAGAVAEDGAPAALLAHPGSRLGSLAQGWQARQRGDP